MEQMEDNKNQSEQSEVDEFLLLMKLLNERKLLSSAEAEALAYALSEIKASVLKIYLKQLPFLLKNSNEATEVIQDLLWDIREEFRHIEYHIKDGKLTKL